MSLGRNAKIDLIGRAPLFASSSKAELAAIAQIADEVDLPEGKTVMREGEPGREFLVLIEGSAEARRGGRRIATMGPGDFFGEIALVTRSPRTATITTTSPVRALVVTDRAFRELMESSPKIAVRVLGVLAERLAPTML